MNDFIIKIKNEYFDPETILNLNNGKSVSLLYGLNGSGKTTITRAISSLVNADAGFEGDIALIDSNSNAIALSENESKRLFVFNEMFVDKNIKEKAMGISSIVILGENVSVDNKIDELKNKNNKLRESIQSINIEKYTTKRNPDCINDVESNIIKILKESYAERGRLIENRVNKIPVTEKTIDEIRNYKKSGDKARMLDSFNAQFRLLDKTRGKSNYLNPLNLTFFNESDNFIINLLNFHEDVELKESLKERFVNAIDKYGYNIFNFIKNDVDSLDYCPLCLRPFDNEAKSNLKLIIDEIFDERTKAIERLINNALFELQEISTINEGDAYLTELDEKLISSINLSIVNYNSAVKDYSNALKQKLSNIKKSMYFSSLNLDNKKKTLMEKLVVFNEAINDYNLAVKEFDKNKEAIKILNNNISYIEIESQLKNLDRLLVAKKSDEEAVNKANSEIESNEKEIRELEQKKRNTQIAVNNINRNLRLIFNDRNRLKIIPSDTNPSEYLILSRGKRIKPNKLSAGERNAIALCYFYESLKTNRDEASVANDENIVIIDDPVTSLDYDAKIGIYSFLGKIIDELKISSQTNKNILIVLSHDFETIQKILAKIKKENNCFVGKINKNKAIEEIKKPKDYSNYSDLLYSVFAFANNDNVSIGEAILNITRRTLEAYSTFNYRDCFSNILKDDSVISRIDDKEAVEYFKNQNFQLLLNPGSHEMYQTNLIPDITEEPFNVDTTQALLKDLLLFIYLTNKDHILRNLEKASSMSLEDINDIFSSWLSAASWSNT